MEDINKKIAELVKAGWNFDIPSNYIHFQIYLKVPTRYFIDTAGDLYTA